MPYREPTLRPPVRPTWDIDRVASLFETALDRVAVVGDWVAARLDGRSPVAPRLLGWLLIGVTLGTLAGAFVVAMTRR